MSKTDGMAKGNIKASFEIMREFFLLQNKFKAEFKGISGSGSLSPEHFYNHKSKTFLKNKRKGL